MLKINLSIARRWRPINKKKSPQNRFTNAHISSLSYHTNLLYAQPKNCDQLRSTDVYMQISPTIFPNQSEARTNSVVS